MRTIVVDGSTVHTEAGFWSAYVQAAEPISADLFGRNLNAFWDGLNGGPGCPGECQLHFINTAHLQSLCGGLFLEALRDIASQSTEVMVEID